MKRKTFAKLRATALLLLLIEAMLLLALFLAQTEASAEVNGRSGASHKHTNYALADSAPGNGEPSGGGGNKKGGICQPDDPGCPLWGDTPDIQNGPDAGTGAGGLLSQQGDGANGQGDEGGHSAIFNLGSGGPQNWGGYGPNSDGGKNGIGGLTDFAGNGSGNAGGNFPFGIPLFDFANLGGTDGGTSDGSGKPPGSGGQTQLRTLALVTVPEPWSAPLLLSGLIAARLLSRRNRAA